MQEASGTEEHVLELTPPASPPPSRDLTKPLLGLVIVLLVGVIVLQVIQLQTTSSLDNEVTTLSADVNDLKPLHRDIDILSGEVASLAGSLDAAAAAGASSAGSASVQAADGSLPMFESSRNDAAVLAEMTLATITGPEYYSGSEVTYAPEDGKARVWMIWAHWCPYCQAELPEIESWWPENSARFPNVELVTISSAIDNSRSNPLTPYLDTEQFSFPVVVDESGAISQKFGTSAFPFWVVTDGEGRVVLRIAGAIDIATLEEIFSQLESITSEI